MKPGGGKNKGNEYEIKVARIFTRWYLSNFSVGLKLPEGGDKPFDYFWRTAGSGAKSTVSRSAQTSFVGDITFLPDPDRLQLWIDTKNVKEVSFNTILSNNKFLVEEWYNKEIEKRDTLGVTKPVVIIFKLYKKNENYIYLKKDSTSRRKDFTVPIKYNKERLYNSYIQGQDFIITTLENFLLCVPKEMILS